MGKPKDHLDNFGLLNHLRDTYKDHRYALDDVKLQRFKSTLKTDDERKEFDKFVSGLSKKRRANLDTSEKAVAVFLALHRCADSGQANPSVGTLALECSLSRRAVSTALRLLELRAVIYRIPDRDGKSPHWIFFLDSNDLTNTTLCPKAVYKPRKDGHWMLAKMS